MSKESFRKKATKKGTAKEKEMLAEIKGLSIYEPTIIEDEIRTETTKLEPLKKELLAKFPTANYRLLKSGVFSIKIHSRKFDHLPAGAAGDEFDISKDSNIYAIPYAASGSKEPPIYSFSPYLREMADPHDAVSRRRFRDTALLDPTVSAGLDDRLTEFYADGYTFGLKLKSSRAENGRILTPEETKDLLFKFEELYLKYVKRIEDWDRSLNIRGVHKMRASLETLIVQGRSMTRIFPPLDELEPDKLPDNLKQIPSEEMGSVIIERRLAIIIAVRVISTDDENSILLPTGVIYQKQRDNSLTREEQFFGRSSFEAIVQASRTHREALNYHIPKGVASTYIPKVLMQIPVEGTLEEKEQTIINTLKQFAAEGNDLIGIEATPDGDLQVVSVQPNHEMMNMALEKYDEVLMAGVKTDPLRLGRTKNMNRDLATILEIHHIRNVRTTDEKQVSDDFIMQLYQKLLAHLAHQNESEIPVMITITRIDPKDETTDQDNENNTGDTIEKQNDLSEEKGIEISKKEVQQDDANTQAVGAAKDIGNMAR